MTFTVGREPGRRFWAIPVLSAFTLLIAACAPTRPAASTSRSVEEPAELYPLRELLPELAKGHSDKINLAFYMTSFLRKVDPAVADFANTMSRENHELQDELKKVAKAHDVSLRMVNHKTPAELARQRVEEFHSSVIQADDNTTFQRDILILMYMDHQWERAVIAQLLSTSNSPDVVAYLRHALESRQSRIAEIRALLARYHYQG